VRRRRLPYVFAGWLTPVLLFLSIFWGDACDEGLQRKLLVQRLNANAAFLDPDLELFAFLHMSLLEHSFRNANRLTVTPFDELSANGCHKVYVIQGIYVGIYVSRKALRADKSGRRLNCAEFRNDGLRNSLRHFPN